ncbi:MAG: phosphate-starvation-inducible PsiE family protein [Rhodovibrio sp.]|nr:phosphate-starvation-inducible PsiE family protein [Rhodovibrio sp.]
MKNTKSIAESLRTGALSALADGEESKTLGLLRAAERVLLVVVAGLTVLAAASELFEIGRNGTVSLADLLLMFLYTEVVGMVAVYYASRQTPVVYPIFIAMTAVARLLVLQSKDMSPEKILFEAGAIVLLAIAAAVLHATGLGSTPKRD